MSSKNTFSVRVAKKVTMLTLEGNSIDFRRERTDSKNQTNGIKAGQSFKIGLR